MPYFLGHFVTILCTRSAHHLQRAQVVGEHEESITVRFADGEHEGIGMSMVRMDPDQTTPVWPPAPTPMADVPIRVGDFVNVMRVGGAPVRGQVIGQTVCAEYHRVDVRLADGHEVEVPWTRLTLSTDQTTPLDGGA